MFPHYSFAMISLPRKIIATITIVAIVYNAVLPTSAASEFASYADALASQGIINKSPSET